MACAELESGAERDCADALAALGVPRETLDRLAFYLDRLRAWNARINLVAAGTLREAWRRHVLDSAQLLRFLPEAPRRLADLGSGAGLPGLVLAICGAAPEVHLVEADQRKAAFLLDVTGRLELRGVKVHAKRAEAIAGLAADVVTARALAPLPRLLELAAPLAAPNARFLLLEGRSAEADLLAARPAWGMVARVESSLTSPDGRVLILDGVERAGGP